MIITLVALSAIYVFLSINDYTRTLPLLRHAKYFDGQWYGSMVDGISSYKLRPLPA